MGDLNLFQKSGFIWNRGNDLGLFNLPDRSNRKPDIPPNIIALCRRAVAQVLPGAFPIKATLFAKSEKQSWALGWHQDRVIPVAEKHAVPGFENWSRKNGVWHVEPPAEYLTQMVFAQIYFDDVGEDDGPMELAVGSHAHGKLSSHQMKDGIERANTHLCLAACGDILICKSLLLHRSRPTKSGRQRRLLRVDFANGELPAPLRWA